MNILITGGYGFLGTNIYKALEHTHTVIRCGKCDDVNNLMNGCDLVIHLSPNIEEVINAMHINGVSKIIYISSGGCVYGSYKNHDYKVGDDLFPINDYGKQKLYEENLIVNSGLKYIIYRPSNVYGKYHKNEWTGLLNISIKKALRGETLTLYGNAIKDYIYVDDLCKIIKDNIENIDNTIYNICSEHLYSSKQIVDLVKSYLPLKIYYVDRKMNDYSLYNDFPNYIYKRIEDVIKEIIDDEILHLCNN